MTPAEAVGVLRGGGVVALPTETVYGLAGAFDSPGAVEAIFEVKGRPSFDPLILHVLDDAQARMLVASWPPEATALARRFWPGPLTLVLPRASVVPDRITAGLPTVAVRAPAHPLFREVLAAVGTPLAAPSANRFGKTSPTAAAHVVAEFGGRVPVVDGGPCEVGVESTVVAVEPGRLQILRPGAVTDEMLRDCVGEGVEIGHGARGDSPGHLKQHYQPEAPLHLVREPGEPERWEGLPEMPLGSNPVLVARDLYGDLRRFSRLHPGGFVVRLDRHPRGGMWRAIRDRLERAATE